jgi:hypothetical protein
MDFAVSFDQHDFKKIPSFIGITGLPFSPIRGSILKVKLKY